MDFQSLHELVEAVCAVESDWYKNDWKICWFRGCDASHELIPGQYRQEYRNNVHDEESTFLEFQQRARGFLTKELSDWEMYFLMQHYRVPTRLLDWTGNCLMALYFALKSQCAGDKPCVWMLNPFLFNEHNAPTKEPYILVPPVNVNEKHWMNFFHPMLYTPEKKVAKDKDGKDGKIDRPIAISPPLVDRRIVAQSSYFTLHGSRKDSIDKLCEDYNFSSRLNFIRKFVFTGDSEKLLRQLVSFGITEQRVFPDLEGLGRELRCRLMKNN
jgi:hypothetical protein